MRGDCDTTTSVVGREEEEEEDDVPAEDVNMM
jgi:hypothetical protein